jgi:hypothetical protein
MHRLPCFSGNQQFLDIPTQPFRCFSIHFAEPHASLDAVKVPKLDPTSPVLLMGDAGHPFCSFPLPADWLLEPRGHSERDAKT